MLTRIGDILPDTTDDCRFDQIKHLEPYYQRIIKGCKVCGGKTSYISKEGESVDCLCSSSFKIILEMLKSNFPRQHLDIGSSELYDRKVAELLNFDEEKVSKEKSFIDNIMMPFLTHKRYMIENSCSMLFYGDNESGKTYAALYMLADFIEFGISGHYLRFKNYLNILNSSYTNMDDRKLLKQIRAVKFLVIDELGKEHGKAEYATSELEELIKSRQDNMSCTILITNLDYKDFSSVYGNHVKSAFNKNFKVVVFHPDARLRKKTRVSWPKHG